MSRTMKDSGIPWIGEIPEGWSIKYGKNVYLANDGGVWGEEADDVADTIVLRSTEQDIDGRLVIVEPAKRKLTQKEIESAKLIEGDLIITKSSGSPSHIGKTSLITKGVADLNCCFSNFIQRLKVDGIPLFYWFLLNSLVVKEQFEFLSTTTTGINNINSKTLDCLVFPVPPLSEQQTIANFLDKKCNEIDELITLQEQMIEELKAYKQSVITEAVTKGIRNEELGVRNYKDSGIEWIGDVPEEWEVKRLKYLCSIQTGNKDTQDADRDGEYLFYVRSPFIERSTTYSFDGEGILMAGDGAGAGRVFHHAYGKYAVHQRVYRLSDIRYINSNYLFYYISNLFNRVMDMGSAQSTVPSVRLPMLTNFIVCCPNITEQQAIADYLDDKCADIDSLIQIKQEKIDSLKEYKKSVIYEYVTGKREV